MNINFKIAWRYFWSKKSTKAINIISWISVTAIAVSVAAILVVLTGFNGIENFIKSRYSSFYPEIKIESRNNSSFVIDESLLNKLKNIPEIENYSLTLEQDALLEYQEAQTIVKLKGIDDKYENVTQFNQYIKYGANTLFNTNTAETMLMGIGISNTLGTSEQSILPVNVYVFKQNAKISIDPSTAYNSAQINVGGVYNLQDEINNKYCFAKLSTLQNLTEKYNELSAIEIKLKRGVRPNSIIEKLNNNTLPKNLKAVDRFSQNRTLYFVLKSEKWLIWAILTLILIIASFNLISTLSMLAIEKQKDFAILKTLGQTNAHTSSIISYIGLINGLIGTCLGIIISLVVYFLQTKFKLLKMGNGTDMLLDAYPMRFVLWDYVITVAIVIVILVVSSLLPAKRANKKNIIEAIKEK